MLLSGPSDGFEGPTNIQEEEQGPGLTPDIYLENTSVKVEHVGEARRVTVGLDPRYSCCTTA